jgi:hypothetical protein
MIDFILAGIVYLGAMFVTTFSLSFVTIGMVYSAASFFRWGFNLFRHPNYLILNGRNI